jgi:hypothetical protein
MQNIYLDEITNLYCNCNIREFYAVSCNVDFDRRILYISGFRIATKTLQICISLTHPSNGSLISSYETIYQY